MIKLKLTNEQLYALCSFTRPDKFEAKVNFYISKQNFAYLDCLFNVIQIGERVSKAYLFNRNKKHSISLNYSEAASLLALSVTLQKENLGGYNQHVNEVIKASLHQQLTNYQTRFYGNPNSTDALLIGGD